MYTIGRHVEASVWVKASYGAGGTVNTTGLFRHEFQAGGATVSVWNGLICSIQGSQSEWTEMKGDFIVTGGAPDVHTPCTAGQSMWLLIRDDVTGTTADSTFFYDDMELKELPPYTPTPTPTITPTPTPTPTPIPLPHRVLPVGNSPGSPFVVSIEVFFPPATNNWAAEETPPLNWLVSNISNGGTWDSVMKKIKWGPFFSDAANVLTYTVTPPDANSGDFSGYISIDGVPEPIAGDHTTGLYHPADTNCDWSININEVTGYGSAWKTPGSTIDINYLTRGGALWRSGETYHYVTGPTPPLCWQSNTISASQKADGALSESNKKQRIGGAKMADSGLRNLAVPVGTDLNPGIRALPPLYVPNVTSPVSIAVTPPSTTLAWATEEIPPTGWTVGNITQGGVWDSINHKIKWGPYFDNTARTLTYETTPPLGESGAKTFAGTVSFDGSPILIGGQSLISDTLTPTPLPTATPTITPTPCPTLTPMPDLSVTDISRSSNMVAVDGLQANQKVYIDRDYVFNNPIPSNLYKKTYIRTAQGDKDTTTPATFLSFDVNRDVTVYVAVDNRIKTPPAWLASWSVLSNGLTVSDPGEAGRRLYAKRFAKGRVNLGPNRDASMTKGRSMYTVVIVPVMTEVRDWPLY